MPGHVVRLNANVCGTRWPRRAARDPDTNYNGNADAAVARPNPEITPPGWWQWCEKSNTVQLCPAAHSFATQRSPWRVLKLAAAEAVEEVKQSAGPCSCHPRPRPEKESKWPACVGAGRGCRGGRTEDGPDKLRPLPRLQLGIEWPVVADLYF